MNESTNQNPSIIKVIGVGGGGSNAVNHMFKQGIKDVEFVICNTDAQALIESPVPNKVQLGAALTEGRGAGNKPEQGKQSAIENMSEIEQMLAQDTKMAFVTAGMGGGTGTGAAPVIAQTAQAMDILTVGIVTIPFRFEGQRRLNQATEGIKELSEHVDSLLVISNEKLREIYGDLTISEAFSKADDVLTTAAKGIAEIITVHGYVNVDFADVQTVMKQSGVAIMGSAQAKGENRAMEAIREALTSPLLNNNNINGARNILLNVTSGKEEATMSEIGRINDVVQECAGSNANIIWGNGTDESLDEFISVTVIATGFNADIIPELFVKKDTNTKVYQLGGDRTVPRSKPEENSIKPESVKQQMLNFEATNPKLKKESVVVDTSNNPVRSGAQAQSSRKSVNYSDELGELEDVPAFKRKGLNLENDDETANPNVSRYSLSDDDGEGVVLRKNSYLHDKVD